MMHYASTLAFLSVAAAWSTDTESSVRHPDAHIDGFVISAVHLHGDDGSLHRRRLRFDEHPPRARRLEAAPFSATKNSRARVLTLMKLNVAAYPSYLDTGDGAFDRTWSEDQITDYTHPIDPWGSATLGVDNGKVCFWGATDLALANSSAREYCGRVYGYTGPTLIAAQAGVFLPGGADRVRRGAL